MIDEKKLDALFNAVKDIKPRFIDLEESRGGYTYPSCESNESYYNPELLDDCLYANVPLDLRKKLING